MSALPNPDTYLNHIPPAQAAHFEAARNLSLAVLGATIWDILVYIPTDVKILHRSRFHLVTFCFVASRVFALTFVLLVVVTFTHPVKHCNLMNNCIGVGCVLTVASTTFIFLQRLRAVYSEGRAVRIIATLLWLGACTTITFTVVDKKSMHIPGTQYCGCSVVVPSLLANGVVFVAFDSFIFIAISYKIATFRSDTEAGISWATAVSGKALPKLLRAILRGGQQYFFITLSLQVPLLILTAIPSVSPNLKLLLILPLKCLAASMAARIFRNMQTHDIQYKWRPAIPTEINVTSPSSCLQMSTTNPSIGVGAKSQSLPHTAA